MTEKRAVIAGITGQDGSYLAELLLKKGYQVVGLTRDFSKRLSNNIAHLSGQIDLQYNAYTEHAIAEAIQKIRPTEIYNLAGQSYVGKSWDLIPETIQNTGVAPSFFMEAILKIDRSIKFFQASSAEIFSPAVDEILTEESRIEPSNPYGCSKAFAHQMVGMFRKYYGVYFVNGIFFNHESPRRNDDFLSKKVARAVARIKSGEQKELLLGNLVARRDWGYAPEYMDAAHRMMQLEQPTDLIISTGKTHSVEDMLAIAFESAGLDWKKFVRNDPKLNRPFETPSICGSNRKIHELTGWAPKTAFPDLIRLMVSDELGRI